MAKRLVVYRLAGIDLTEVWDVLISAAKDIALVYGGSVLAGGLIGGIGGAFLGGVGAIPGVAAGATAGGYIGTWVLTLLGLGSFIDGMNLVAPEAFQHYEKGFTEAWGPERHDPQHGSGAIGNPSTAAFHLANGHATLVVAILAVIVAYLTRGKGDNKAFLSQIAGSKRLGPRPARWFQQNQERLHKHPALQSRGNGGAKSGTLPSPQPPSPPASAQNSAPSSHNAKPDFIATSTGDVGAAKDLGPNKLKGLERELRVVELSGGKSAQRARIGKDGELIVEDTPIYKDGNIVSAIDVFGKNGELIQVGGPGKNANPKTLEKTKRAMEALKEEAEKRGVSARVYLERGDSERFDELVREAGKILGKENVIIF